MFAVYLHRVHDIDNEIFTKINATLTLNYDILPNIELNFIK